MRLYYAQNSNLNSLDSSVVKYLCFINKNPGILLLYEAKVFKNKGRRNAFVNVKRRHKHALLFNMHLIAFSFEKKNTIIERKAFKRKTVEGFYQWNMTH